MASSIVDVVDKVKFNIIKAMIDENIEPTKIINQLKKYQLGNYKLTNFKKDVLLFLNMEWDSKNSCWEESYLISFYNCTDYTTMPLDNVSEENATYTPQDLITENVEAKTTLKINPNIKIPTIAVLQLACSILEKGKEISVSPNDAETLLKNMACIQSKINEIAKAINKIGEVINSK